MSKELVISERSKRQVARNRKKSVSMKDKQLRAIMGNQETCQVSMEYDGNVVSFQAKGLLNIFRTIGITSRTCVDVFGAKVGVDILKY